MLILCTVQISVLVSFKLITRKCCCQRGQTVYWYRCTGCGFKKWPNT